MTEEPSGEHKFSGGWLLFLFIFSHIHEGYSVVNYKIGKFKVVCMLNVIGFQFL